MFTAIILATVLVSTQPVNPTDPTIGDYFELINKKPCNNKAIEDMLLKILDKHKNDEAVIKRILLQESQCIGTDVVLSAAIAVGIDPSILSKYVGPTGSGSISDTKPAPSPMSMSGGGSGSGAKDNASNN